MYDVLFLFGFRYKVIYESNGNWGRDLKIPRTRRESVVIRIYQIMAFSLLLPGLSMGGYLWLYNRFAESHRVIRCMTLKMPDRQIPLAVFLFANKG